MRTNGHRRAVSSFFVVAALVWGRGAIAEPLPADTAPSATPSGSSAPAPANTGTAPASSSQVSPTTSSQAGNNASASSTDTASPPPEAPLPPYMKGLTEPLRPGQGKFHFGSYGRVTGSIDGRGGAGRDADIVARGSRLDESSYVELELRREDNWTKPGETTPVTTRIVTTLALFDPLFHYSGKASASTAIRNLYLQTRGVGSEKLSLWVGSRMYRGDDVYLLDFWPLDNLNTVGGGAMLDAGEHTSIALHVGTNRLDNPYQYQLVDRARPFNQFGTVQVPLLNRPRVIETARVEHILPMFTPKGGLKLVGYGELHQLAGGQRESSPGQYEDLPADSGFVAGLEVGAFSGSNDTYINVFFRHARGLAAYGDFATPYALNTDKTTSGANETRVAVSANWETGPIALLFGGYFRSFRTASPDKFNYDNLDEGIVVLRPHYYFTDRVGVFVEGSFQQQQRAILNNQGTGLLKGSVTRFGVVPFVSPAGKGSYRRPHLRAIWTVTARDEGARSMYAPDDAFARRPTEHFFGLEAEWWFNSSYR
ncbi:MAG: carbohydrate porin [Polyangiaceae bacterium]